MLKRGLRSAVERTIGDVKLLTLSLKNKHMVWRKECTVSSVPLEGWVFDHERLGISKFNPVLKIDDIVFHYNPEASLPCVPVFCQNITEFLKLPQETSKSHMNTNILPFCRIFSPCRRQIGEEQTGGMVSTHYLAVIGTWCKNHSEVTSLEVCIFIGLSHTFWYGIIKCINYERCTQFTRTGWNHCFSLSLILLLRESFGKSIYSSRNKTLYGVSPIPCLVSNAGEMQFELREKPKQQIGPQGRSAQQRGKGPSHADLRSCRSIFWERLVQGTIKRKTRRRTSRDQIELVVQEDSPILFRDA